MIAAPEFRAVCSRCLRPESACWCRDLPGIPTRTRVVFLQHPRERYVAIGTARMAHLALPGSSFIRGVQFDGDARVEALADDPHAAILFPSDDAADLRALAELPRTLVVVDGTWSQARKLVQRNPVLQRLPRVRFAPVRPGNYRIRKEPAAHCLSTIEAVVEALGILEGEPERFLPMLGAFEQMIDLQIARTQTRTAPPRRRLPRNRPPKPPPIPPELRARAADLVLAYSEANAHPAGTEPHIAAELIHLVAERPATGERFDALLAPRRPLAETTPHHLGIAREKILAGEPLEAVRARWNAFLRPDDLFATWGFFGLDLLREAALDERPVLDLRSAVNRLLKRRPGGIEAAAQLLGAGGPRAPFAEGRAGVRLEALGRVLEQLQARLPHPDVVTTT